MCILYLDDYKTLERNEGKRHIGVPDHGGIQRIIQTGAIATALGDEGKVFSDKFDVVFAQYYITPPTVRAIRPEETKCIEEYRKEAQAGMMVDLISSRSRRLTDGNADGRKNAQEKCC